MIPNHVKLEREVTFVKHFAGIVSLICPSNTLIWYNTLIMVFPASGLLNPIRRWWEMS